MRLSIFDLDNTLIGGDSDVLWTEYLVERGVLSDADWQLSQAFYEEYEQGRIDIQRFLEFQLGPLAMHPLGVLEEWRSAFIEEKIRPRLLPRAVRLLADCRAGGHRLLIITATNRFITAPIASMLDVEGLLATELEISGSTFTGRSVGTPCFREGKISRLEEWLRDQGGVDWETWFYSDSRNDIPLLEYVDHPVAVDPDPFLARYANEKGWPSISLR